MNREEAQLLLEEIVAIRNSSEFPFKGTWEQEFREHAKGVAEIASTIAEKCGMDSEKAYIFGLLHDGGKLKDDRALNTYHGLVGYDFFMERGLDDLARISLTHTPLPVIYEIFSKGNGRVFMWPIHTVEKSRELFERIVQDEYDMLLQLADILNDRGEMVSVEKRFEGTLVRYGASLEDAVGIIEYYNGLKRYFDEKCGCDIYEMLGLS